METFWREIQTESFFEVRFDRAMMNLAARAARSVAGRPQQAWEHEAITRRGLPGIDYPEPPDPENLEERLELIILTDEGLRALPHDQARVLIARYWLGYPIESQDAGRMTVGKLLGWSARQVHNLLRAGEAGLMRRMRGDDPDD